MTYIRVMATPTRTLIELQLGSQTLSEVVTLARQRGSSWQRIATLVHKESGVLVSWETLRGWFAKELAGV